MWYIHIFALFELYLEQSNDKPNYLVVPLTEAAPKFPQKLNPFIYTLLIAMPTAGARPKATKIYLTDCAWSRNLPKTQHTSYTHTLTLQKYFSSASHDIILSLSYDLISYTLFLLFLHFFCIILRFSSLSSSCSIQSRFILDLRSLFERNLII